MAIAGAGFPVGFMDTHRYIYQLVQKKKIVNADMQLGSAFKISKNKKLEFIFQYLHI